MAGPAARRLVVPPEWDGQRLDRFLAEAAAIPRRRARVLIADGSVRRNGETIRVQSRTLEVGDAVELPADAAPGVPAATPELPRLLHEDRWLVAVDKLAGELSQAAERMAAGELAVADRLLLALAVRDGRRPFLRLVHRLDRQTSGVLLFARSPEALAPLARSWQEERAQRRYLAIVAATDEAVFGPRVVDQPIARDPGHAWRFRVDPGGRPSRTEVELEPGAMAGTLVARCRLVTGRTHQVRVHLAAIGLPVLGDRLYGGPPGPDRPLLHAHSLAFPHPRTGRTLIITSPPPPDLAHYLSTAAEHV